ncbi:TPA: ion transporter [Klebsiella pneumoniae]|nr:ion transporter [Klebsiella pneumoniae]
MMLSKKNSEALENFSEKLEVEGRSLWQDARRRFMHNRAAVTSLIMLVLIALFVTFAPMVSSFSYFDTDWGMMSNAPDMASGHYFGTDSSGRDLLVRVRLYHLLFDQNRRSGRRFEGLCGLFALLSVLVIFIESGLGTQYHLTLDEWHIFVWLELLVTAVFTLEYLLRIATWPNPLHYIFSFWGLIDLATILPLYVMWLWPEISLNYVFAWRAMRAIRALRILKLLRFMPSLNVFWRAIVSARHQLILFYSFIAIVMVIFGSLMYLIEGPEYGFTTLNASVYWAIVTITTVGYGDITPHTPLGRILASILILIGYSIIAIPTGLITTHMTSALNRRRQQRLCPQCQQGDHDDNARFCHACGHALPK